VAPSLEAPPSVTGQAGTAFAFGGFSVSDADAVIAGQTIDVRLTDEDATNLLSGPFHVGNAFGATVTSGPGAVDVSGTLDQVNAALATLTYLTPTSGSDRIFASASDGIEPLDLPTPIIVDLTAPAGGGTPPGGGTTPPADQPPAISAPATQS